MKFAPNHSVSHFATLEGILGTEITTLEGGVLAGCDEFGPFTVGCRDTLTRYPDATFSGTCADIANYDAVAYDADRQLPLLHRRDRRDGCVAFRSTATPKPARSKKS